MFQGKRVCPAFLTTDKEQACAWPRSQRGQAIVLILLLTVVGVLIGLSLVNVGIATSEKMQLQNAADATAYSVSVLEARDLNFASYTNRAMVANEVAMAQMVGMMSWAVMANSTASFLDTYFAPIYPVPIVGQIVKGIISVLQTVTGVVRGGVTGFTRAMGGAIPYFNQIYSFSQRSMHLATLYLSGNTLFEMIDANADDAQLSAFGYLTLARHINTYYSDLSFKGDSFVTSYRQDTSWDKIPQAGPKPSATAQEAGMERLAGLVNAARDPFSVNRRCGESWPCDSENGGWAIPMLPPIHISEDIRDPIFDECIFCVNVDFEVNLERHGGSDLRYVKKKKEQHYVWTGADATGMVVDASFSVDVPLIPNISLGMNLDVPFGIGGAQAASKKDQVKPIAMGDKTLWPEYAGGRTQSHEYGSSPDRQPVTWLWASPYPGDGGPSWAAYRNNINAAYPGLPRYNDSKTAADPIKIDKNMKLGWEAPYLLVGLTKDAADISQSDTRGRFALDFHAADGELAALGKSEVYFERPMDLTYYMRADGATELANTFNPYWSARLVDTSYIDRTAAISMQQEQLWLPTQVQKSLDQLQNMLGFLQ